VVGVILMVAITVVLAAAVGTFVFGLGESRQTTPRATFESETDDDLDTLNVTHVGGESPPGDPGGWRRRHLGWGGEAFVVADSSGVGGAEDRPCRSLP
jgi:hypothetical protein